MIWFFFEINHEHELTITYVVDMILEPDQKILNPLTIIPTSTRAREETSLTNGGWEENLSGNYTQSEIVNY